jgi:hypothetical protein
MNRELTLGFNQTIRQTSGREIGYTGLADILLLSGEAIKSEARVRLGSCFMRIILNTLELNILLFGLGRRGAP